MDTQSRVKQSKHQLIYKQNCESWLEGLVQPSHSTCKSAFQILHNHASNVSIEFFQRLDRTTSHLIINTAVFLIRNILQLCNKFYVQ